METPKHPSEAQTNSEAEHHIQANEQESIATLEAAATDLEGTNARFQQLWGKLCSPLSPNPEQRGKLLKKIHSEFGFFLGYLEIGFAKHTTDTLQVKSGNEELTYHGVADYPVPSSSIILHVGEGYEGRMYSVGINHGHVSSRNAMRAVETQPLCTESA